MAMCSSCRKELCYEHFPTLDMQFSWELEWERDYGRNHIDNWNPELHHYDYDELRPSVPEWVKMVHYKEDGRIAEHFFPNQGDKLEVNEGESGSILFYNGDTEYIILSDMASLHDVRASATTRTRSSSSLQSMQEIYQVSRTTNPPDVIYASYVDEIPGVQSHTVTPLPVKMQPLVYTYVVVFEFEYGIQYVSVARGALGGMAEGVYLRTGITTDETSIILFDCDVHSDACRSQVRSFGIPSFPDSYFGRTGPKTSGPFTLSLEVRLKNGKTQDFTFDVSDQIENQPRGGLIKVGGIRIEDETGNQSPSGFDVDVSGWDEDVVEVNLTVGPYK